MIKNVTIVVLLVAFLAAVGLYATKPNPFGAASGTEHYNVENLYAGYTLGSTNYTTATARNCTTATWNPGSLATSTITNTTSTDIALTGATMTDTCSASLSSATTSAIRAQCNITGTATATISIVNLGTTAAAIDVATGTATVCFQRN